jgi:hypothetical protein
MFVCDDELGWGVRQRRGRGRWEKLEGVSKNSKILRDLSSQSELSINALPLHPMQ